MRCSRCQIWTLNKDDRYCGFCGFCFLQTVRVYVDPLNISTKPSFFPISVRSSFSTQYSVQECPPWIEAELRQPTIKGGQAISVGIKVKLDQLGGVPYKKDLITLLGNPGGVKEGVYVELYPAPQVSIRDVKLLLGQVPEKCDLEVEVLLAPITMTNLTFDPPLFVPLNPSLIEMGMGENSVPVRPEKIASANTTIKWAIVVQGLEKPLAGTFDLSIVNPATLEIKELEGGSIYEHEDTSPDCEESVHLTLVSRGDEVLEVSGASVVPVELYEDIEITPDERDYPLRLATGGECKVAFHISIGSRAKRRRHYFNISFLSNDPRKDRRFTISFNVKEQILSGFISLDFGTTDSAVAYLDGRAPFNVLLEKNSPDKKIFSNIFFKRYDEKTKPPYHWCIGKEAKQYGPGDRNRFLKAIKTKVGQSYIEEIFIENRPFRLEAESVVQFILMDLLKRARRGLRGTTCQAILSVPTRFTLRQKAILKDTFMKAAQQIGINLLKLESIDESLAAGLFFLMGPAFRHDKISKKNQYTLLVADFGGGTTDVTLFRIHHQITHEGFAEGISKVEIIGAWGDETLGGEDISWKIARILAERFLDRKVDEKKDWRTIRDLEDEAEAVKLVVSEMLKLPQTSEKEVEKGLKEYVNIDQLISNLRFMLQNPAMPDTDVLPFFMEAFRESPAKLPVYSNNREFFGRSVFIHENEVTDIYRDKLRGLVDELRLMLSKAGIPGKADVILLAGQSSQFPIIFELLKEVAEHIDYIKDLDGQLILKECVSLGAILYSLKFHSGGLDFPIEGLNRIWTRLGIPKLKPGGLDFEDLIPWGAEYGYEKELDLRLAPFPGDRVGLSIHENHTLGKRLNKNPIPYCTFFWQTKDLPTEQVRCRIRVTERGDIEAKCFMDGKWVPGTMEVGDN